MPYLLVKRLLLIIRNRNLWLILKKILVTSRDNGLTPFPANHYKQFEINIMNWYIYWHFTIKYFFWGLLGYGRAGNYIGFLFFYLPFIALIMALIAPLPFVNDNKILIYLSCSVLFIFINEIVFWDETKRYRRWNNHYRNNNNNRKSWFFCCYLYNRHSKLVFPPAST